ncbi:alpha/beta hydrolase [Arenibacter sp. F26102]|uniref:alpha/beta hydrolase n=1 Tax=Arenibacter sp. F26102 TaxID=2926416 RepID=UPI001FF39CC9|nr:alpha/beta hydrolase [Arenibacter sp. F26102]MCK0145361.1 alpha/beta hydrolase [Arenibacter sp. F26102]
MKLKSIKNRVMAALIAVTVTGAVDAQVQTVKNVVLVHGAFTDGSSYQNLYKELANKGYNITIVQNPLTSLEDDVAATNLALDKQDGPTILVGHSWAGVVITESGNHSKVAGLVYIDAYQPDKGQSALDMAMMAAPSPENGVLYPDENGIVYYDKTKFHAGFCADLSKEEAEFMYAAQGAFHAKAFGTPVTTVAWKNKPTYGVIGTEVKSIDPDSLRTSYKKSNTEITEIKGGSHVVFISQPAKVAAVIIKAAKNASK